MKPIAIDLFCGLGGWTDGLLAEGWDVIGYDIEAHEYGDMRYPAKLELRDVLDIHGSEFAHADLIVASPPCQEYSYMAMPWTRAKAKAAAIRVDATGKKLDRLNRLFNACFRIQREACDAAGRHIPMIVENVRGAQEWVGQARWNYGSFYLWGDVPALMPPAFRAVKAPSMNWSDPEKRGQDFTRLAGKHALAELKPARISDQPPDEGRKGAGAGAAWFDQNASSLPSSSPRRKAASAIIAKIPFLLSSYLARHFRPAETERRSA
jgi:hypothetical protein